MIASFLTPSVLRPYFILTLLAYSFLHWIEQQDFGVEVTSRFPCR